VSGDDRRDLPKHSAPEPMPQFGEAPALGIIEAEAAPFQPRLQNAVLFTQECDDVVTLRLSLASPFVLSEDRFTSHADRSYSSGRHRRSRLLDS
jgi:hypothetical protein